MTEPASPAKDAYGHVVPDRLKAVFEGRAKLLRWRAKLQAVANELTQFAGEPFAREIDLDAERRTLAAVASRVSLASPYEQCDCDVHDQFCPKCNGTRWVTAAKQLKSMAPPPA